MPTIYQTLEPVLEEYEAILIILFCFGGFSVVLALVYNAIRRHVFGDIHNLDQSFDAGGRVSTSLTAVTVAVQLLWPADLMQSATVTSKYGISGAFWYSNSIIINIMLFPLLSLQFKTRAPGAKTYLQLIKARFGKKTHLLYCLFALLTNAVVTATLIVAGTALFQGIIKDISIEMIVILMAALFGSYSFVGGLGSTFYVSYFNAVLTLCVLSYFVIKIFYLPDEDLPFGSFEEMHAKVSKLVGPPDNEDQSYLTFWSTGSMVWAGQGTFICLAIVFCDQASWQSKIAAKPTQGVIGFFLATFLWFAIPSTIGTSAGLVYLAFTGSTINTTTIEFLSNMTIGTDNNITSSIVMALSDDDVNAGLVTPFIARLALGKNGALALMVMFTMLMMSTGSGEVMAVSSVVVYDIYQSYIQPYRKDHKPGHCILCGKAEVGETTDDINMDDSDSLCCCPSTTNCNHCEQDMEKLRHQDKEDTVTMIRYTCPYHGQYRTYQDSLIQLKNWVILWVALSIVPLGILVIRSGINLNWIFLNGAMIVVQAFAGILTSIIWVKATKQGLIAGSFIGLAAGLSASFTRASYLEGGLSNFLENTADGYAVLAGSATCFFVSIIVTVAVSMATHRIKTPADAKKEWQKLRDIDNPLRPWVEEIKDDGLQVTGSMRPTYKELEHFYRLAKYLTYVGSAIMVAIFILIIPGCMASLHTMTSSELRSWLTTLHVWCFVTCGIVLVLTPLEEVKNIMSALKERLQLKRKVMEETERLKERDSQNKIGNISDHNVSGTVVEIVKLNDHCINDNTCSTKL